MDAGARTRDIEAAARFTSALLSSLPVPKRLRETGIAQDVLEPASVEAATNSTVRANPKPTSQTQILQLLQGAW
jgi:alcohol dehydrogenase class IV